IVARYIGCGVLTRTSYSIIILNMKIRNKRQFKDELYAQFARIGKALSNPHRLELLDLLAQGERTVEDLAHEANLPIANASQHLQVLRATQLVDVRRDGLYAYYRLSDGRVFRLWQALRDLGELQLAEVDRLVQSFLQDRSPLQSITTAELLQHIEAGNVVILDVRPEVEYQSAHIPEARSIPIDELETRLDELPRDQEIIAYCRGPYCVFADEAVTLLQKHGYRARRLVEGLPDWQALNLPVESMMEKN
ncbi:MAG TPA: metalloregulator ArsR/SmtB family transcription factor, partial [Anaerolineales bacterium]